MTYILPPRPPDGIDEFAKKFGVTTNRPPTNLFLLDDNISFHSARLALLLSVAGRPRKRPRIDGRTKFAKLDFFVRYPVFLAKAVRIAGSNELIESTNKLIKEDESIESGMIRYKYGPWDSRYYLILAYMLSKRIIEINTVNGIDSYILTERGKTLSRSIQESSEWESIVARCEIVGMLFEELSGIDIKNFIDRHFPEIVHTPHNQLIVTKSTEVENAN